LTNTYLAIIALAGVAIAAYLALRRLLRPADPDACLEEVRRLFADLTDEEQDALLVRMRAWVEEKLGEGE